MSTPDRHCPNDGTPLDTVDDQQHHCSECGDEWHEDHFADDAPAPGRHTVKVKVECPTCHRRVTPWRFTSYPHAHKMPGAGWCPGGFRTPSSGDTRGSAS